MIAIPKLLLLRTAFYFLVIGLPAIFSPKKLMNAMQNFVRSEDLIRLGGLVALVFAYLFLMVHYAFDGTRYVIFSFIGWIALLKGLILMRYPKFASTRAKTFYGKASTTMIIGIVLMLLAVFFVRVAAIL